MKDSLGYIVVSGDGDQFFEDAAAAMRYAAFMAQVGCDSVFFNARTKDGVFIREERVPEQFMRACVDLGL